MEQKGKGKGNQDAYPAKGSGKGKGKSKGGGKGDSKGKAQKPGKSEKPCPFFAKNGACKKGDACDMSHALPTSTSVGATGSNRALPSGASGWSAPDGAGLTNPFAAFTVVTCGPNGPVPPKPAVAAAVLAAATRPDQSSKSKTDVFTGLDQLPKDWWKVVDNERGGYQYKTVTKILDKMVETLLDGGAGSNHVTEELVVSILNRAATLGLKPGDKGFPIVQFEQWIYPEFVHGIASGSPVPLKGSVVLKVRLQEGPDADRCVDGHELYVRCKIAAKGTSDWHGLILGGRALDCEAGRGLGFRPGPEAHILDTLGVQIPRCEDASSERKDRAYVLRSVVSGVETGAEDFCEPCTGRKATVVFSDKEAVQLLPGEGALVPVRVQGKWIPESSECEAVLPIEGRIEAVPGLWDTGSREGMVLRDPATRRSRVGTGRPSSRIEERLGCVHRLWMRGRRHVVSIGGPTAKSEMRRLRGSPDGSARPEVLRLRSRQGQGGPSPAGVPLWPENPRACFSEEQGSRLWISGHHDWFRSRRDRRATLRMWLVKVTR